MDVAKSGENVLTLYFLRIILLWIQYLPCWKKRWTYVHHLETMNIMLFTSLFTFPSDSSRKSQLWYQNIRKTFCNLYFYVLKKMLYFITCLQNKNHYLKQSIILIFFFAFEKLYLNKSIFAVYNVKEHHKCVLNKD